MSPRPVPRPVPRASPSGLVGSEPFRLERLIAHALDIIVSPFFVKQNPLWALYPLEEASRKLNEGRYGANVKLARVNMHIEDGVLDPDSMSAQDTEDGFMQRLCIIQAYVHYWNREADRVNPRKGQVRGLNRDERSTLALETRGSILKLIYLPSDSEKQDGDLEFCTLEEEREEEVVRLIAILKVAELGGEADTVPHIPLHAVRAAIKKDVELSGRPIGIVDMLAEDTLSPGSVTARWDREGNDDPGFTSADFLSWACEVSESNEKYVRSALQRAAVTAGAYEDSQTKGKRLSVYCEVLRLLRERGAALEAAPIYPLWGRARIDLDRKAGH